MNKLAIIIPTLNEAQTLPSNLEALRSQGAPLIVVDGGSTDNTPALAAPFADQVLSATRGRASQMNAGAQAAAAQVLLFLHADTALPPGAAQLIQSAIEQGHSWGRFDVRINSSSITLQVVSTLINWRSRISGIATGDQAIFVRKDVFDKVGGYDNIPLMEDIALCKKLKRHSRPACLCAKVQTSARRWEQHGVWRTIFLMWTLRAAFFFGCDPHKLAKYYA